MNVIKLATWIGEHIERDMGPKLPSEHARHVVDVRALLDFICAESTVSSQTEIENAVRAGQLSTLIPRHELTREEYRAIIKKLIARGKTVAEIAQITCRSEHFVLEILREQ